MSKKFWLTLCSGVLALQAGLAIAQSAVSVPPPAASTPESIVRQTIMRLVPKAKIDQVTPAPMPGFYQVITSGHLVYVSADGKYVMNGDLIDGVKGTSLTDDAWATYRKAELAKVPVSERIVFAPPHPKYTVTVFTDVTCPYCRVLHSQIAAINKEGIAVQYLAWPRSGVTGEDGKPTSTYNEMVSIWCASDRNDAFTQAKKGRDPKPTTCNNPVKDQFDLGLKLGVTGTPAVYAEDGTQIGGYLAPEQMLEAVKEHSGAGG
ncbi:disulfide isomerase DsbC N-terminal domain-containing protein [Dyella psychrodurans]|uniref:Thiol:disulfide interchange protein n=1 Tax=Dyella psychrodurans TaxID=1927960 RepID=A0A370X2V2_9GAMM|nr:thioredoxin fold domain-containing protein [Dyella psychrodurans]RDS82719.1 DsbC family protein [Dyella psychrodurans]